MSHLRLSPARKRSTHVPVCGNSPHPHPPSQPTFLRENKIPFLEKFVFSSRRSTREYFTFISIKAPWAYFKRSCLRNCMEGCNALKCNRATNENMLRMFRFCGHCTGILWLICLFWCSVPAETVPPPSSTELWQGKALSLYIFITVSINLTMIVSVKY